MPDDSKLSPLQLRVDLVWAKGLLWLASSSRFATPKPEVHRFMFDRYWRLADHHKRHGAMGRAARLRALAEYHYQAGGLDDPPPAVAVAMAVPSRPRLTWAVAAQPDEPGDDAA